MKHFIPIPVKDSEVIYHIRPLDIVNMIQYSDYTQVSYKFGERICSVYTLLTAKEVDEAIENLEVTSFDWLFSDDED